MEVTKEILEDMNNIVEKTKAEIESFKNKHNIEVNYIFTTLINGEKHNINSKINVRNDHHMMDMLCSITKGWWKSNHE